MKQNAKDLKVQKRKEVLEKWDEIDKADAAEKERNTRIINPLTGKRVPKRRPRRRTK